MTTYKDRFWIVIGSDDHWKSASDAVKRLAQLIYANDRSQDKEDCVVQALEEFECMTGRWWDPSRAEYDELIYSII